MQDVVARICYRSFLCYRYTFSRYTNFPLNVNNLTNKAYCTFSHALLPVVTSYINFEAKALETDFHLMAYAGTPSNKEFNDTQLLLC